MRFFSLLQMSEANAWLRHALRLNSATFTIINKVYIFTGPYPPYLNMDVATGTGTSPTMGTKEAMYMNMLGLMRNNERMVKVFTGDGK